MVGWITTKLGTVVGLGPGCALFMRGSWVQHKVAWAEAYLHAKFLLIHPIVWPQYTNVTDKQTDRT